ncbi:hypothetical protein ElyMa_006251600 [Elysia marginata]|uniref:Uncharacterized protein n=1 Tax=Elysia marginata TaxID=1093978 RepID=A0AAV4H8H7_9GAST|nr:hypothetical protein ElyMa_006251600 [Elysia marginata]
MPRQGRCSEIAVERILARIDQGLGYRKCELPGSLLGPGRQQEVKPVIRSGRRVGNVSCRGLNRKLCTRPCAISGDWLSADSHTSGHLRWTMPDIPNVCRSGGIHCIISPDGLPLGFP